MSDDEGYKTRDPRLKKRESEPAPPGKLSKKKCWQVFMWLLKTLHGLLNMSY